MNVTQQSGTSQARSGPPSKSPAYRQRILALLRERGPAGITNIELNRCAMRFGTRLYELRRMGFRIETIRESESVFRFVLREELAQPGPLPAYEAHTALPCTLPLFRKILP